MEMTTLDHLKDVSEDIILNMPAGVWMDALVQKRILGHEILGLADCWYEGGWMVMGEPAGDGGDRPVFLSKCLCDPTEAPLLPKIYGHERSCMEVVPEYSTSIGEAFKVLRKVAGRKHWRYCLNDHDGTGAEWGDCYCRIMHGNRVWEAAGGINDPRTDDWEKEKESVAICRAALLTTL